MKLHVLPDIGPHGEEDALAFVVAGAVLVRQPEIAGDDRTVDSADDLREGDLARVPGEDVAASHASFGPDEAGALQREQDLFEIWLR